MGRRAVRWAVVVGSLLSAPAFAQPVFESAEGLGGYAGLTPSGDVEAGVLGHAQGFGNLDVLLDDEDLPMGTYGASGASLGVGNAGLWLEGKGDGGLLIRPASAFFPAVGFNLGLGMRADTARDEIGVPGQSDDWIQAQAEVAGGFGIDADDCRTAALARIGAAVGGEGVPGHGVRFGPLVQLDCPGLDLAVSAARTEKEHTDDRPMDLVDTASFQLSVVTDRKRGYGFGVRAEVVAVNEAWDFEQLDRRFFFMVQVRPTADDDDDDLREDRDDELAPGDDA